jgi:hypothetical protein
MNVMSGDLSLVVHGCHATAHDTWPFIMRGA